jgi:hypothetical protein
LDKLVKIPKSKKKKVRFFEPKYTHISSPSRDEEIIFPLKINTEQQKSSLKPRTHLTHKINRKMKSTSRKSKSHKISQRRRTF